MRLPPRGEWWKPIARVSSWTVDGRPASAQFADNVNVNEHVSLARGKIDTVQRQSFSRRKPHILNISSYIYEKYVFTPKTDMTSVLSREYNIYNAIENSFNCDIKKLMNLFNSEHLSMDIKC